MRRLPKPFLFSPGLELKEHQAATTKELRRMLLKGLEDEVFKPLLEYRSAGMRLRK